MDSEDEEEMAAAAAAGGLPAGLPPMPPAGGGGLPGLGAAAPPMPPLPSSGGALPPVVAGVPTGAPPLPPVPPGAEGGEPKAEEGGGGEGGDPLVASFFIKEKAATCEVLFVPEGYRLQAKKVVDLTQGQWAMPGPSTLLCCDAGTVHPRSFAALALAKLADFKEFWTDAQQHARRAGATEAKENESFALGVINTVIWVKLCTIFSAILDAAQVAENWIVIDRIVCKSPAADLLVEAAMAQTSSRPPILVIDALNRLQNFKGQDGKQAVGEKTQKCIDTLKTIKGGGVVFGTDGTPGCATVSQFYDATDFLDPNADTFVNSELPRPPEKVHVDPAAWPDPPHVAPRVKWCYHYLQTFFASGSHYIVLEHHNDAPDLSALGSFGFVCANGQALMFDRLKRNIQAGESIVMLHNTGGVVQAFASLRAGILSQFPPPSDAELLDMLDIVSPQKWSQQFGLPEILMMKELHQRAPMLLRTSVVAVDVMRDTSEDVLSTLTCCFAGGGGVPELGLGEAEGLCILTAWKRHMTLMENAYKYEKIADAMQMVMYVLGISTTLIAIVNGLPPPALPGMDFTSLPDAAGDAGSGVDAGSGDFGSGSGELGSGSGDAGSGALVDPASGDAAADPLAGLPTIDPNAIVPLDLIMVLLPLTMTFLATLRTKMRPREKWSTCLMAGMQIISQIYYYRLRTDRYDTQAAPQNEDEDAEPISPKMRECAARQLFVDTCSEIYSNAISTEVSKGGALMMGKMAKLQTQYESERTEFMLRLRVHVDLNLYHKVPAKEKKEKPDKLGLLGGKKKGGGPLGFLGKKNKIAALAQDMADQAQDMAQDMADQVGDAVNAAKDAANGDDDGPMKPVKLEVGDDLGAKKGAGNDDLKSQLPIESYVDVRVRNIAEYFERRAPVIARRAYVVELVGILANTGSTILGVLGLATWAPVTVAIASAAMAVADYFMVPSQLAAINRALEESHNLLIRWDSLSLVQRKTRKCKLECANIVENAILACIASQTGVSPALPSDGAGGGDDEEEG